jgi:hypothetical protein
MSMSLARHGGSLRNRERAQGVTRAGESIDKSRSCTVHYGRGKVGIHMAHGIRAGKMLTGGRRGSARSFLAARRGGGWRGGLLLGARSQRPWRKGLRRLERKRREMKMGCVGAASTR